MAVFVTVLILALFALGAGAFALGKNMWGVALIFLAAAATVFALDDKEPPPADLP